MMDKLTPEEHAKLWLLGIKIDLGKHLKMYYAIKDGEIMRYPISRRAIKEKTERAVLQQIAG